MRIYFEVLFFHLGRKIFMFLPMPWRVRLLRSQGVRIGRDCLIHSPYFSVEPYLVQIGDRVAVSSGTEFLTHDATGWIFPDRGDMGLYGPITVGNNVYFGVNCMVLPGTTIGSNCVIGAGSVVRGVIPDNSVVLGNPAAVIMKTSMLRRLLDMSDKRIDTRNMSSKARRELLIRHFGL